MYYFNNYIDQEFLADGNTLLSHSEKFNEPIWMLD